MKYPYKYPQAAYPYVPLIEANRSRDKQTPEFELLDTGIFDEDRYFEVFIEYAKAGPEDILIQITAWNRGPEPAELQLLPTIWFRNTWSWDRTVDGPELKAAGAGNDVRAISASHRLLGERFLYCEGEADLLFTEDDTNGDKPEEGVRVRVRNSDWFHMYNADVISCGCSSGTTASIRTARCPPTNGTSATSTRPSTRGRSGPSTATRNSCAARAT